MRWKLVALTAVVTLAAVACVDKRPDGRTTVVALGDSLTAPVGKRSHDDWWRWADSEGRFRLLAAAGVPGQRSDEILARVDRDVVRRRPDVAIVLAGTNDIGQGVEALTIVANLAAIYDALTTAGIRFVAITIPPMVMLDPAQVASHEAVNAWLRDTVDSRWAGARLADWSDELSVGGDGVSPRPDYFVDGIHFSSAGARAAGEAIARVLAELEGV